VIREALRKDLHPDKTQTQDSGPLFNRAQHAYKVLSDPLMRRFYDRYGPEGINLMPHEKYGASSFHDEELSVIVAEEDRFAYMQRKMSSLMRDHEEVRVQRLQSLSGTCSMAASRSKVR